MKPILKSTAIVLLTGALFQISCKKNDIVRLPVRTVTGTKPPFANAGSDQILVLPKDSVRLDGSGSVDPDGNIVSYLWTQIAGPGQVVITKANAETTTITGFSEGDYSFKLQVTDNAGVVSNDIVGIKFLSRLSGFEYSFQQAWGSNDGAGDDNDVYVSTLSSPDLFSVPGLPDVFIRLGTSPDWISVPKDKSPLPNNSRYFYLIGDDRLLVYASYPGSFSELIGKAVTVKIKFL